MRRFPLAAATRPGYFRPQSSARWSSPHESPRPLCPSGRSKPQRPPRPPGPGLRPSSRRAPGRRRRAGSGLPQDREGGPCRHLFRHPGTRPLPLARGRHRERGEIVGAGGERGDVRLGATALSRDGKYFAYGVSNGGSDWQEYRVMETATRKPLPDRLRWIKVSGISWYKDGFFYSRYPAPADTTKLLSASNENHRVFYHRVGTPQSEDRLVFEDPAHPKRFHTVQVTDDERYLVLSVSDRSTAGNDGNAIWIQDLSKGETGFRPVIT